MNPNPWHVDSIQEFSCLKCPECMFFTKEEFDFKDHAMENHPQSFELFGKYENEEEMTITEDGPVTDKNSIIGQFKILIPGWVKQSEQSNLALLRI